MKKLLFLLFLFTVKTAFAQKDTVGLNIPLKNGNIVYAAVVNVPGKNEGMLNTIARIWLVKNLEHAVLNNDNSTGTAFAKGKILVPFKGALGNTVYYDDQLNIQVDVKDNKYRITITDQFLSSPPTDYGRVVTTPEELLGKLLGTGRSDFNKKQARRLLESVNTTMLGLMADFNNAMAAKTDGF